MHIASYVLVALASAVVGYRYGAKAVADVKAELAKVAPDASAEVKALAAKIKAIL